MACRFQQQLPEDITVFTDQQGHKIWALNELLSYAEDLFLQKDEILILKIY